MLTDEERLTRAHVRQVLGVRRSSLLLLLYVVFYVAYLVTGGLVFAALESPAEMHLKNKVNNARNAFLERYSNVKGYGHVTPLSKVGKIFCIVYAMVGIPLTLVLLTALVERLMVPATVLLQFLNSRLGHLYQPFNIRLLHLSLVVSLLVGVFFLLPAGIFASLEPEWDFLDSLYYCFISLTTIGLGDYIPGDSPNQPYRPIYKVATTGYLLVGLTFMMLTLTVFYDIPQLNFGLFFLMRSDEMTGDPEKVRLQTPGAVGPKYTQQLDDGGTGRRAVVRVKSRRDDSPSPEDTTPVHARP
ncbi:potassium channel subfamily K member 1 isoform X2 [Anabrus simplex]|uniref:potassium channel subfamily K member 1 isoform X2 n=1 Tax=Anabrus simplex TaxID=316456 RepID=UPI0035A39FA5